MTGMLLYSALGLIILTVLSNRFWRRQLTSARVSLVKLKESAEELGKEVTAAAREHAMISQQFADAGKRAAKAEQEAAAAVAELEAKKAAPVNRYYVPDTASSGAGRFYEAAVRYNPDASGESAHRAWKSVRRYILVAETEREARERIAARFPRTLGFEVVEVAGCRLANLQVNRIAELSTFRRPSRDEEEDTGQRSSRRRAAASRT